MMCLSGLSMWFTFKPTSPQASMPCIQQVRPWINSEKPGRCVVIRSQRLKLPCLSTRRSWTLCCNCQLLLPSRPHADKRQALGRLTSLVRHWAG
jgi:hypothetical protein